MAETEPFPGVETACRAPRESLPHKSSTPTAVAAYWYVRLHSPDRSSVVGANRGEQQAHEIAFDYGRHRDCWAEVLRVDAVPLGPDLEPVTTVVAVYPSSRAAAVNQPSIGDGDVD